MPHTHSSLRAQFLQQARFIASEVTPETDHHDIAQVDRVREILLMAIRLIDDRISSPYQIEKFVDERIEEIQEEMRPFVPDPFAAEPPASEPEQSRLPPYFFSGVVAVIHNARRVNEASQAVALQATPPRLPLLAIDSASSSSIITLEDPESPSYGRDRVASIRARLRAGPPLTRSYHWMHIHTRLQNMLDEHITAHTHQYRGLDYHETIGCLEDALETAGTRPGDLSPSRFMEWVEMDLESFKRVEDRRRDFLEASQDDEGRPDNEDQQEDVFGELTDFEDADEDLEDEDSDTSADSLQQKRASTVQTTRPLSPATTDVATTLGNWHDPDLTTRRKFTSPQTSITKPNPPVTPSPPHPRAQLRSYTFLPIKHDGSPMRATPPTMRRFYRRTVEHTLEGLLNSTTSPELRDLVHAYWAHVEAQVPRPTANDSGAGDL
ncbi:hypothetical protein FB567DRAFT_590847 [Paraphoma chrysanthemicola]|uniref:Uncharacterized protein n=1 Tax=Paraphoma chrysanthemicola TaxID=798071 RepID=A0A8K0RAU1_9PLEO|nr:hypothetical protein FB567DRAFT_590847 [Paraphoma chrysanthemicola]